MTLTIVVAVLACIGVLLLVLIRPYVKIKGHKVAIYYLPALVGAIILMAVKNVDFSFVASSFTENTAVNPLKILVLFISMTILSIYLDELGFFRYLATLAVKRAGKNGIALFTILYFTVGAITIVTSNDIIILTFSPFICYFAKNAKINPLPYLIGEFVSANTWSMALIIGNPTNIFLATGASINFVNYATVMAIPTIFAGVIAYLILLLIFGKTLKNEKIEADTTIMHIEDKIGVIIGLVHLIGCTILLAIASYVNFEMWLICLAFAISLFICITILKLIQKKTPKELLRCLKRSPWELIPFVLSMFIIVLALEQNGISALMADFLSKGEETINYGFATFFISNIINNIPASVFLNSVISSASQVGKASIYAAVIGTNIGAYLTPVGALAGIMWSNILSRHDVKFGFLKFILYGLVISIPTLFAAIGGLYISMLF